MTSLQPIGNQILSAMARKEFESLLPHLEVQNLRQGEVLHEFEEEIHHVFFPGSAIVCLLSPTKAGGLTGVATVGKEGMLGILIVLGAKGRHTRRSSRCRAAL